MASAYFTCLRRLPFSRTAVFAQDLMIAMVVVCSGNLALLGFTLQQKGKSSRTIAQSDASGASRFSGDACARLGEAVRKPGDHKGRPTAGVVGVRPAFVSFPPTPQSLVPSTHTANEVRVRSF
jgi:hypothetical protein